MKFTIRLKLLVGFTLILILSVIIQGFVFYYTNNYVSSQLFEFQQLQAKKGAGEIQKFFSNLSDESFTLARIYQTNSKEFAPAANYALKSNGYIKKVTVLSPLGRELVKFDSKGQVPQDRLTFEVFSEPLHSAVAGRTNVSKVYYIERGLGPHIDIFSPIFADNSSVVGIVKMQINLTLLNDTLRDIKLGESGHVYVVDNEGRLLTHPSSSYVLERPRLLSRQVITGALNTSDGSVQTGYYINESNNLMVAQAVRIPGYNWVTVFEQPQTEAFGFLIFLRNLFISIIIGSTVVMLFFALLLSESLTRPIRKLKKSVQEVEKGKNTNIEVINSRDEIESLSYSFASLVHKLVEREHSLQRITVQLEKANSKLKELDTLKNEFVSVASHELRTPMTAIKSYLWMALEGKGGKLNEKQEYYIQRGYNSVDRLIRLVNDMLNISRIEAGRITIDMQEINLPKLAQEVVDEVLPRAKEVGVTVSVAHHENLPMVLADPDKIKEVFFNLIGNSLKFTPQGGSVTVTFTEKDGMVETEIKDTGAGIDAEDIGKLFQKFGLLPGSYTTNQPAMGTGLGLYICRSIVELHQGKIWAASDGRGKGAIFTFQLKVFNKADLLQSNHDTSDKKESVGLIHSEI